MMQQPTNPKWQKDFDAATLRLEVLMMKLQMTWQPKPPTQEPQPQEQPQGMPQQQPDQAPMEPPTP